MPININRGRQFLAGDVKAAIFDEKGVKGTYLDQAAAKLAKQKVTVTLQLGRSTTKTLSFHTATEWKKFLAENCSTKEQVKDFGTKFGIGFDDFLNVIDDAAASTEKGYVLDLRPKGELGLALSLDKVDGDYGKKLAKDAKVVLTTPDGKPGPEAVAVGVKTIGPDILPGTDAGTWDRDRTEQESWVDFKSGDGAGGRFKENTGPAAFAKLYEPKWDDAEAMALVNQFSMPLHLEVSTTKPKQADGTPTFQDGSEMFRETYFDDKAGTLAKSGASVRARVRFDDDAPYTVNRVLVQAKEGREVNGDRSAVRKFEKRWEGTTVTEDQAKDFLQTGKDASGKTLPVSQKLYKLAADKKKLPKDGQLTLEPKYVVLQKRRRTHLQLDSVSTVQARRTHLQTEMDALKTAGKPVPKGMTDFAAKLDKQISLMTDMGDTLKKYGKYMPSGEAFIISADRYSVYDATARAGKPPVDIDDEEGRIGKGPLHIEAEWDSASSDGFEKAMAEIDKRLAATPKPSAAEVKVLKADKKKLEGFREMFRQDVQATVDILRARLEKAGLTEEPTRASKEQRASDLANSAERPVFWQ